MGKLDLYLNSIKSERDIEKLLNAKNLVNIPVEKDKKKSSTVTSNISKLVTHDAFKLLRTNLQFIRVNLKNNKNTFLITSCGKVSGKSYISSNIAIAFARSGKRVVLVDADMHNNKQSKVHKNELGLSNYISGLDPDGIEIKNSYESIIRKTKVENLYLITTGTIPPNAEELLTSRRFEDLLNRLKEDFDIIFIDGAPILQFNDSVILTKYLHNVILVVEYNKTKKVDLVKAKISVEVADGKLVGTVLHQIPADLSKINSSFYYGKKDSKHKKLPIAKKIKSIVSYFEDKLKARKEARLERLQKEKEKELLERKKREEQELLERKKREEEERIRQEQERIRLEELRREEIKRKRKEFILEKEELRRKIEDFKRRKEEFERESKAELEELSNDKKEKIIKEIIINDDNQLEEVKPNAELEIIQEVKQEEINQSFFEFKSDEEPIYDVKPNYEPVYNTESKNESDYEVNYNDDSLKNEYEVNYNDDYVNNNFDYESNKDDYLKEDNKIENNQEEYVYNDSNLDPKIQKIIEERRMMEEAERKAQEHFDEIERQKKLKQINIEFKPEFLIENEPEIKLRKFDDFQKEAKEKGIKPYKLVMDNKEKTEVEEKNDLEEEEEKQDSKVKSALKKFSTKVKQNYEEHENTKRVKEEENKKKQEKKKKDQEQKKLVEEAERKAQEQFDELERQKREEEQKRDLELVKQAQDELKQLVDKEKKKIEEEKEKKRKASLSPEEEYEEVSRDLYQMYVAKQLEKDLDSDNNNDE